MLLKITEFDTPVRYFTMRSKSHASPPSTDRWTFTLFFLEVRSRISDCSDFNNPALTWRPKRAAGTHTLVRIMLEMCVCVWVRVHAGECACMCEYERVARNDVTAFHALCDRLRQQGWSTSRSWSVVIDQSIDLESQRLSNCMNTLYIFIHLSPHNATASTVRFLTIKLFELFFYHFYKWLFPYFLLNITNPYFLLNR